jgi:general secretion pathway protein G
MKSMVESLKMFKIDNGRYPTTKEGLSSLVKNPEIERLTSYSKGGYFEGSKVPKDSWGGEYLYIYNEDSGIDIISFGPDGKEGGKNDNVDIYFSKCK